MSTVLATASVPPSFPYRRWFALAVLVVAVAALGWVAWRLSAPHFEPIDAPVAASVDGGELDAQVAPIFAEVATVLGDARAEETSATSLEAITDAAPIAVELLADGGVVVDLNLANESDLRRLPGVGATRARAIVELRARVGRFRGVDDLARIKGFGRATIRKLRPMVRASPAPSAHAQIVR